MKISELQELLKEAQQQYGDIQVLSYNDEFASYQCPTLEMEDLTPEGCKLVIQ